MRQVVIALFVPLVLVLVGLPLAMPWGISGCPPLMTNYRAGADGCRFNPAGKSSLSALHTHAKWHIHVTF